MTGADAPGAARAAGGAPRRPPPLLGLTPGDLRDERAAEHLAATVRSLAAEGLEGVLLREPELDDRALLELARALRAALPSPFWLGVHDRAHLASLAGADGLHLGFRSLPPGAARALLGQGVALGLSTHAADLARPEARAAWDVADYLFHGPVHPTVSKAGNAHAPQPVGEAGLARALEATAAQRAGGALTLHALGGIDAATAGAALATGCDGVVVRGALFASADPRAALLELLDATRR